MKNVKFILYFVLTLFIIGCDKDDDGGLNPIPEAAKVTSVSLNPVDGFTGSCAKKFDFEAAIKTDGPMTVTYTWLRSDGATAPENTITFDTAGTKTVTTSWTLGESGNSYEGYWQQLKIIGPKELLSNKAEFDLYCDEEVINISVTATIVGENEFTGECPKKFDFEAEITVDAPTTVSYTWLRSDGATAPEETLEFESAGTKTVTTSWTLGGSGSSYEGFWQQLKVLAPTEVLSNKAEFDLFCAEENTIELVSTDPSSPATLFIGDRVNFSFNYTTGEAGGVRIFGRPFTKGNLSPDYAAHASPIHPAEAGTDSGFFTINTPGKVDQIRFQMFDADQNNLLYEFFVDVDYTFITHELEVTAINPEVPATLCLGERVEFSFNYNTNEPTGVRIFGRPLTGGTLSPNYGAHGSPIHPTGEGMGTGFFTLNSPANVDQIRFQIFDADQNNLLHEFLVDVDYTFVAHQVEMTSINPNSPAILVKGERVEFSFDYKTSEATGVRIFGRPFTAGSLTPGYGAHGSPAHPTGEGSSTGFFTINSAAKVDQIRFQMLNAAQTELLYEYFVDVDYEFTDN